MAQEFYGFFDSITGDTRSYTADNMAAMFRMISTDGVRAMGTNLQVVPNEGDMLVRILPGAALLQGYLYELIGGVPLTLALTANGSYPRKDRIILRLDLSTQQRIIQAVVLPGVPAASPVPPVLTRTGVVYEISLATVSIPVNDTVITADQITDERADETVCGRATPHVLKFSTLGATHAHDDATTSAPGFLSAADKTKLDDFLNQAVKTTSAPTFAGGAFTGDVNMNSKKITNAVFE